MNAYASLTWGPTMTEPLLSVSNLEGWYNESQALFGTSLNVHEGEVVTILGRNGMGKTTTLRAIVGILQRRRGEMRFDGHDLMNRPVHKVAKLGLGYVPEERGIFASLSVTENLMLPPKVAEGGMSLDVIYDLFPNLLERRTSMGNQLSGGEQQMLAIARVLRTGVRMILLDEPTEGLAPVIINRIGEVLKRLKESGMTVLLVEQNFRFASKVSDRFYVMDHGAIADEFAAADLPAKQSELARVLGV